MIGALQLSTSIRLSTNGAFRIPNTPNHDRVNHRPHWDNISSAQHLSFQDCPTMESSVQMAYDHLHYDSSTPRNFSAFWTDLPQFIRHRYFWHAEKNERVARQLKVIISRTLKNVKYFGYRDLSQTTLGLAKVVKNIERLGKRPPQDGPHQILRDVFIGDSSMKRKEFIFNELATASVGLHVLEKFDPRHLSNFIYAFGLARYAHEFEDGKSLFDVFALEAIPKLGAFNPFDLSNMLWAYANAEASNPNLFEEAAKTVLLSQEVGMLEAFNSQDISNMVWAYARAGERHPELFEKVGDHIDVLDNLSDFSSQALSNIIWAYATTGKSHPKLFEKLADRISALDNLRTFTPQALSNIVWAYATLDVSHPILFKKVADHIVDLPNLRKFKHKELANLVWSYATAAGNPQPMLFEKVGDHISTLGKGNLRSFRSWHLSNIAWAYATANESHPELFDKLADPATKQQHFFTSGQVHDLLWAYATNGQTDQQLFKSLVPVVKTTLREYDAQELANIAWAYSVVNAAAPSLFNDSFINACLEKRAFTLEGLSQLHQWQLWQMEELHSNCRLPPSARKKCRVAFASIVPRPLAMRGDVISELSSMGLPPQEEVFVRKDNYRLDAVVKIGVDQIRVGIEVDGASCFAGRNPRGGTILKRRQIAHLEGIRVISVPYWEWMRLGKDRYSKQAYLRALLGLIDLDKEDELVPH